MEQAAEQAAQQGGQQGEGEPMYFEAFGDHFGGHFGGHFQEQAVVVEDPASLRDPYKAVKEVTSSGEEEQ
jgi:hypothetical protein